MTKQLNIFDFEDYRKYLKEWVSEAKRLRISNSSALARALNVHTTFLSHVLSGEKGLSLEQAVALSEELKLTKIEREYFFILVQIDRAGTVKLRDYFTERKKQIEDERKKLSSRVGKHHELTDEQRAIFYSSWIYVAIFVACAIDDSQSLDEIATLFELSREKAQEHLSFLVQTGICEITSDQKYKMGQAVIYVPNSSPFVIKHHMNWRVRALEKMDHRDSEELFFTSPMSMAKKDFIKIRDLLARAIEDSMAICKESPAEEVVNLNIDFFKIK